MRRMKTKRNTSKKNKMFVLTIAKNRRCRQSVALCLQRRLSFINLFGHRSVDVCVIFLQGFDACVLAVFVGFDAFGYGFGSCHGGDVGDMVLDG